MSAALSAARALTTGTLIAASAATLGIGVHLANDHIAALSSPQASSLTNQAPTRSRSEHSGDDSGGLLGQIFQGSTATGGQGGISSGAVGGSQTRTRGS